MILLIDNYDSFSYNLYQLIGQIAPDIKVIRNDEMSVSEIDELSPEAIILSPGPGKPSEAGICEEVVRELGTKYPILGVCLGHQAIFEAFGGTVSYANELMHGKKKPIRKQGRSWLFDGIDNVFFAARYHSLVAIKDTLPKGFAISAVSDDEYQEIMAIEHNEYPIFGLQFHPESVMTPDGKKIIENFFKIVRK